MEKSGMVSEKPRSCSVSVENESSSHNWSPKDPELQAFGSFRGKGRRRWKSPSVVCLSAVVVLLTLLSLLALAFCVHLYGQVRQQGQEVQNLRNDYHKLQDEVDAYSRVTSRATQRQDAASVPLGLWQLLGVRDGRSGRSQLSTRRKRSARGGRHRGNSIDGNGNGNGNEWYETRLWVEAVVQQYHEEMAKVHLRGLDHGVSDHTEQNNEYLPWKQDPNSFQRVGVSLIHHHGSIKGIQINQPGVYLVYSQVVINGTDGRTYRRDCNHETVRLRGHEDQATATVLMSGYTTQDQEGLDYADHPVPFPRDSSLQMGLFRLLRQDQVRVRIPDHSGDCRRVNFATDTHASYFGLFKIE